MSASHNISRQSSHAPFRTNTAVLHTVFFHRYFVPITPLTRDLLELTYPVVNDVDLETLVDQRATALVRAIEEPGAETTYGGQKARVQLCVQFFEKKRRKTYFFGKADESICWEQWVLDVVVATPRTQSGRLQRFHFRAIRSPGHGGDAYL